MTVLIVLTEHGISGCVWQFFFGSLGTKKRIVCRWYFCDCRNEMITVLRQAFTHIRTRVKPQAVQHRGNGRKDSPR